MNVDDYRDESGVLHVCCLSGGKDSTAMALALHEREPRRYLNICTPTGNELPEMWAHWRKLADLLDDRIWPIIGGTLESIIKEERAIPNHRMRFCTRKLKIEPFKAFLLTAIPAVAYIGLRADEAERVGANYGADVRLSAPDGVTQRYPLREWGWDEGSVRNYLSKLGIDIPPRTDCALCIFQGVGEWWWLWSDHPEEYEKGVRIEKEIGYTFRAPGRDTWPQDLEHLREEFERGLMPRTAGQLDMFSRRQMCRTCTL